MRRLPAFLALLAVLLGACASRVPAPASPGRQVLARLASLASWRASGRLAAAAAGGGFNASFDWRERDGQSAIDVHGPFGAGGTHLVRTAARIEIVSASGAVFAVDAPFTELESVLEERLGFALPLASLRFWMLGVPDPGTASTPLAGDAFLQDGWRVRCEERRDAPRTPAGLPRRLVMERGGARIRIVIDRWETEPS